MSEIGGVNLFNLHL